MGSSGAQAGFERIAQTILGAPAASIDFTSIPATFSDLLLTLVGAVTGAAREDIFLRFNADATANYDWQRVVGIAAAASAGEGVGATGIVIGQLPASATLSGMIDALIAGYASGQTFHKTVLSRSGLKVATGTSGQEVLPVYGLWRSAVTINQITLAIVGGDTFPAGVRATLWGLR